MVGVESRRILDVMRKGNFDFAIVKLSMYIQSMSEMKIAFIFNVYVSLG